MYRSNEYNIWHTTRGNWGNFITTSRGQISWVLCAACAFLYLKGSSMASKSLNHLIFYGMWEELHTITNSCKMRFLRSWGSMDLSNHSILSSSPLPNLRTFGFFTSETGLKFGKNSWKHIIKIFPIFWANGDLYVQIEKENASARRGGHVPLIMRPMPLSRSPLVVHCTEDWVLLQIVGSNIQTFEMATKYVPRPNIL